MTLYWKRYGQNVSTQPRSQNQETHWIDRWTMQQVRHLTAEADHAIYAIHTKDITETNALIYSMTAAKVIARHISTQKTVRTNTQNSIPPWRRLENRETKSRNEKRHQQNGEW